MPKQVLGESLVDVGSLVIFLLIPDRNKRRENHLREEDIRSSELKRKRHSSCDSSRGKSRKA